MLIYLQTIETEEDKSKFEDIYREYRGLMYYIAYRRLHHEQDAEDAVHHAFMKIAENIKIIDPVSPKTKQLVVTIVDNRVTDMLRMNGRHPTAEYNDEITRKNTIIFADRTLFKNENGANCAAKLVRNEKEYMTVKGDMNNGIGALIQEYS